MKRCFFELRLLERIEDPIAFHYMLNHLVLPHPPQTLSVSAFQRRTLL